MVDVKLYLSWTSTIEIPFERDPAECVYRYSGSICLGSDDGVEIGMFRFYYVDAERVVNNGGAVFEAMDGISELEPYSFIYGPNEPVYNEEITDLVEEGCGFNLLVIEQLEIFQRYRGMSMGLHVMHGVIERMSQSCGYVVITPYPLQYTNRLGTNLDWEKNLRLSEYSDPEKEATEKLCNYYGKLGFIKLPNTPHMIRSTAMRFDENYV